MEECGKGLVGRKGRSGNERGKGKREGRKGKRGGKGKGRRSVQANRNLFDNNTGQYQRIRWWMDSLMLDVSSRSASVPETNPFAPLLQRAEVIGAAKPP